MAQNAMRIMDLPNQAKIAHPGAVQVTDKGLSMDRNFEVRDIEKLSEIGACHAIMKELRPHLKDVDSFVQQVMRQREQGFRLSAAWRGDQIVGVIGYRSQENLLYGRFVFVDDLVVREEFRSSGAGALLLSAARAYARATDCKNFVVATGLHMALAQRFYFRQGLLAHGLCFSETLLEPDSRRRSYELAYLAQV